MHEVASYTRNLPVSLERMIENALDWEHLPYLHAGSFATLEIVETEASAWTARVLLQPAFAGLHQTVRLSLERESEQAVVWVTEILAGLSRGMQVHTRARSLDARRIEVHVRFLAPRASFRYRLYGRVYRQTYRRLYDEDEAMMVERQVQLDRKRSSARLDEDLRLGPRAQVLAPGYCFERGGHRFRVVEHEGELLAFSTLCPHLLGPLEHAPVVDGAVRCPWHGYCFDLRSGQAREHKLRLTPAPRVVERDGAVWALPERAEP